VAPPRGPNKTQNDLYFTKSKMLPFFDFTLHTLYFISQVTFIYIALFTIQIVPKQLHSDNMKIIQHRSIILLNILINVPN